MAKPLDGITVFDMTLAGVGPFSMMELAALGANIVKIEAPSGDIQKRIPPYQRGVGILYGHFNLGKRSIVLDLKQAEGRKALFKLAEMGALSHDSHHRCTCHERFSFSVDDCIGHNLSK